MIELSQTRQVPPDLLRRLAELDPTATCIYLGWNRWYVGRVRPTNESVRIAQRMLGTYWRMSAKARATRRGVQRYRFALACAQGFRPVAEYTLPDLDGRIIQDFAVSQAKMLRQRTDLMDDLDRATAEEQAARQAELRSESRARDSINYLKQSNFGYAVSSIAKPQHVRSGFVRHSTGSGV